MNVKIKIQEFEIFISVLTIATYMLAAFIKYGTLLHSHHK